MPVAGPLSCLLSPNGVESHSDPGPLLCGFALPFRRTQISKAFKFQSVNWDVHTPVTEFSMTAFLVDVHVHLEMLGTCTLIIMVQLGIYTKMCTCKPST